MTTLNLANNETIHIRLEGGRTAHLYLHVCPTCTSLDVWTTNHQESHAISEHTGAPSRAPMGLFTWTNGMKETLDRDKDSEPTENGWPAVATVTTIWKDEVAS